MSNRTMFRLSAAAVAAALALPAAAGAQDTTRVYRQDTLRVTTKRYPALRTEIPQKIEVLTERDLRRATSPELADVLKEQSAVDVVQYPGLLSGIGIRGFRPDFSWISQRTLILLDGRPAGITNLSTIDPSTIERIEVLKGPASSLYGSSAMGGAVNLITRRTEGAPRGSFSAGYGSWETLELNGRVGGSVTRALSGDLSFSRFSRGGDYRIGDGHLLRDWVGREHSLKVFPDSLHVVPEEGSGEVLENTRFGYTSGSARLGYELGRGLQAELRGQLFDADDVETPGDLYSSFDTGGRKNLGRRTGELALSGTMGRHSPLLRGYLGTETTDYFDTFADDPFINYNAEVEFRGLQLQDAVSFGPHALTAGVDYTVQEATSRAFSAPGTAQAPFSPDASVTSRAAFAEGKFTAAGGRLTGTLGGRYDRITLALLATPLRTDLEPEEETFGVFNPSAGLQFVPVRGARVHGTIGRAFVTPEALFKAGLGLTRDRAGIASITLGNPALRPESSVTWDVGVGLERPLAGFDADVTYFHTDVSSRVSQITAAFPADARPRTAEGVAVGSVSTWVNASTAEMAGIEWRVSYDLGALVGRRYSLRLFGNATHFLTREEEVPSVTVDPLRFRGRTDFRPEEVADALVLGASDVRDIRNVAAETVTGGIDFDQRRFGARLSARYVGERADLDFSDFSNITPILYPSFMTVDLVTTLRFAERFSVNFLLDNVTDENYYEKRGFNLPGRTLRVRFTADF
ncbi:MAG: TonB-dependent receptor [Gemmatimonadetes bacterium]|nr:TonB-dependent receptor [Gemmatimonadota bacterium]